MNTKSTKLSIQVGDKSGEFDIKVAPIIEALWKQGINVIDGSEEHRCEHYAMLFFDTSDDAGRFLEIMDAKSDDDTIHQRIFHPDEDHNCWDVDAYPGHYEGDDGVTFMMFVHFPKSDIDTILKTLLKV